MKILIADDHPLFRDAFKGILLQIYKGAEISQKASFGELMALKSAEEYAYDMVFIDLAMPKGNPHTTISYLTALNPEVPIIIISGEESQEVIRKAVACGAIGFLPKSLNTEILISNLEHMLTGAASIISPILKPKARSETSLDKLTTRQREVLELLCDGNTNKMIANTLDLTEGTVKLHVRAILQTMGASNRTHAVAIARKISDQNNAE